MLGLVLTAGGARGAYQAGVLKRIGEMRALRGKPSPFSIVAGASAGAINGAMVAATAHNVADGTHSLAKLWADLTVEQVFRTDALSMGALGARFVRDLSLGGLIGGGTVQSLLDTTPLRAFMAAHLPMAGVGESIRAGHLYALAVSATSYHSGKSFTFIQGKKGHPLWIKSRRVALPVELTVEHICASAAIPIVFPPVQVGSELGECWFGDGGMRLVTPFSPAIRLGADRIFAVGIRCQSSADALSRAELRTDEESHAGLAPITRPPLAQICGVFLNAIFLDHLDTDLDHLNRMNDLIANGHGAGNGRGRKRSATAQEPMRRIEPMVVNPSADLAIVAAAFAHKMPRAVRYVLDGLGTPDAQSADLMSYLLFDSSYTRALIDIGYQDATARLDEIESFLLG